jgi:ribosomal protein S18 acetylase RimI-like enzyme
MARTEFKLVPMASADVEAAVELIRIAMNQHEADWARRTLRFHFSSAAHALDDGRSYFLSRQGDRLIGMVGLHSYIWGPTRNVWLAWFAVHPDHHGRGLGTRLLAEVEKMAVEMGYEKFFVETYDSDDFEKARAFYQARGFSEAGRVRDYLPDGSAAIIYQKRLYASD